MRYIIIENILRICGNVHNIQENAYTLIAYDLIILTAGVYKL